MCQMKELLEENGSLCACNEGYNAICPVYQDLVQT